MSDLHEIPRRDANGHFLPGQSGNPAGKKPGTRNRATILSEMLDDGEARTIARSVIDKALAGNAVAARFIVGRLTSPPRGRPIELDLPQCSSECGSAGDILAASNTTVEAMAAGEITPEEALTVTRVLDFRLKAVTAAARERLSSAHRKEPSPPGRGQGEGAGRTSDGSDIASARYPHPNPLPEGEGIVSSAHGADGTPHPSSAAAMRPPERSKGWAGLRRRPRAPTSRVRLSGCVEAGKLLVCRERGARRERREEQECRTPEARR